MKRISYLSTIFFLAIFILSSTFYFVVTPDRKIVRRAFTVGGWSTCNEGPSLYDRYISNLSYAYLLIPGTVKKYQNSGRGLILGAINVAKCNPEDKWISLDTKRVIRGIRLGLSHGESINEMGGSGAAAIHLSVAAQRLDILKFLVINGADTQLKTASEGLVSPSSTALEMAYDFYRELDLEMEEIIQYLEQEKFNKRL